VGTSRSGEDVRVLRPGDIRRIPERHALVVAGTAPPIIAKLRRCLDGKDGLQLKTELDAARDEIGRARADAVDVQELTAAALSYARGHRLAPSRHDNRTDAPSATLPEE
jgi:hypothetical protein